MVLFMPCRGTLTERLTPSWVGGGLGGQSTQPHTQHAGDLLDGLLLSCCDRMGIGAMRSQAILWPAFHAIGELLRRVIIPPVMF